MYLGIYIFYGDHYRTTTGVARNSTPTTFISLYMAWTTNIPIMKRTMPFSRHRGGGDVDLSLVKKMCVVVLHVSFFVRCATTYCSRKITLKSFQILNLISFI